MGTKRRKISKNKGPIPRKDGEEWALVTGNEEDGWYISNLGRFRHNRKLLKTTPDSEGYYRCNIGHKKLRVHRLVAQAFIPNPDNLPVVDHKDTDKSNNTASNLRWVTQKKNVQFAADLGHNKGGEVKEIISIDTDGNACLWDNQACASRGTDTPLRAVNKVVNGIDKTRNGYKFIRIRSFEDKREKEKAEVKNNG